MAIQLTMIDQLIGHVDRGLKACFGVHAAARPYPADEVPTAVMSMSQRRHAAGLMRVNHVGEVCAQALYQGQALTARDADVKISMQQAAAEEVDHLCWCEQRLRELDSHTSYLNPLWYLGALSIGVVAGLAGDQWNLGFVAETERQVVKHLEEHVQQLPRPDQKSRAVVLQMRDDEAKHATMAVTAGAVLLPEWIQSGMRVAAKLMTRLAYWL